MAPPLSALYTTSFILAALITLIVCASLRLIAILPHGRFQCNPLRRRPIATRVLVVLGSGGHTHEMFDLLRDLDTKKYTHRTYVVSSGDAFSAGRAAEFERGLEETEKTRARTQGKEDGGNTYKNEDTVANSGAHGREGKRHACVGPDHYNIVSIPRARKVHQPLLTTPFTSLITLFSAFSPLLSSPPLLPNQRPQNPYEAAAQDLPGLIITNGPGTGVIVVCASLILRYLNWRGANSRGRCRTIYVESFARVKSLSLSAKLLERLVDRLIVQWEELVSKGAGRAEYWGILV